MHGTYNKYTLILFNIHSHYVAPQASNIFTYLLAKAVADPKVVRGVLISCFQNLNP